MAGDTALERGRAAFDAKAWTAAFRELNRAAAEGPLAPEDLVRLGHTAHLLGHHAESSELLSRAHQAFLAQGEITGAARVAIWLAFHSQTLGEVARGGGWIARAQRLLDDYPGDCVERGYLLLPQALRAFFEGDPTRAHAIFAEADLAGVRFRDRDLTSMARHGQGRSLIRMGQPDRGVALLDEVMVAITSGEVSPIVAGDVYCSVIDACNEIFDLRRAQEWTAALAEWCASQPDMVPYRAACLVHRAEILQLHGAWPDAMTEAALARDRLTDPPGQFGIGAACYQMGELHRLRGSFAEAEACYFEAARHGRQPVPGLPLLRLAQGQPSVAASAIRRALDETRQRRLRALVLAASVEILLAADDSAAAMASAEEITQLATELGAPSLQATAAFAMGSVLLARGEAREALHALRAACEGWRALRAPYEAARTGVLIARACQELGDRDSCAMERDAARRVFEELGALPDLARLDEAASPGASGPLTARETEVLGLIAAGRTNRAIAKALGISEKTVARHVSNIFTKLGLSNRAAATAYAYQHQLVSPPT